MTKHHVCQNISGLERRIEELKRKKKKVEIPWLLVDGKPATLTQLEIAIDDAKKKGYDVIPPCNNITKTGHCAGHENIEE